MQENPFDLTDEQVMEIAREKFVPTYLTGKTASDLRSEVYGLCLAHALRWDTRIMHACAVALEDANFHTEAGVLYDAWDDNMPPVDVLPQSDAEWAVLRHAFQVYTNDLRRALDRTHRDGYLSPETTAKSLTAEGMLGRIERSRPRKAAEST